MNRLQYELSPYLVSHADDPVDWYPWGREAFARAKAEGKPLLISIGTCPDNPRVHGSTVARLTGRYYVPVQVDAREYPDVAAYYMQAAHALRSGGHVPLEVLADGDGRPFFTCAPLSEVELAGLLSGVALHWNSDPGGYEAAAEQISREESLHPKEESTTLPQRWDAHFQSLQARYDSECGGFGQGGKQLLPQEILFLLAYAKYTGQPLPLEMAVFTLRQMAFGGVRDHIGGGFFRGTADRWWRQPIMEKRLIDQAWMLECYVIAYAATGVPLFAEVARETADFVLRELRHAAGGFYTAQWSWDGFYTLTAEALTSVLGGNDSGVFCRQYDMSSAPGVPNLLRGESPEEDTLLLHDLRMKVYRYRLERGCAQRDDMVLVGQNGVMIAALCRAGRVLGVSRYLTAAVNGEQFLRRRLVGLTDVRRYWCHGAAAGEGMLEDYAGYALGQLELYRSGCGGEHLRAAAKVMARADALFSDWEQGGYFMSRGTAHLPERPKQLWDTSVPSAWSVALQVITALSEEIRHPGLRRRAGELIEWVGDGSAYALAACMPQ